MTFPSANEISDVLKQISESEPTLVIDFNNASKSDILKYRLCQEFVKVLKEENLSQVALANKLGVDKSIVNKIVHHKIETFTVDRLIDLFSSIKPLEVLFKAG
ncbi:MAG: XRE family transcriptional regulator [Bacteriovoracaceae bacterium]